MKSGTQKKHTWRIIPVLHAVHVMGRAVHVMGRTAVSSRRSPVYVNTIPPASSRILRAISSSFTANSLSAAAIGLMLYPVLRAHRAHIPGYITAVHMPVRRRPPAAAAIILRIFRGAGRSAGQYGYGSYVPPAPRHHSGRRRGHILRSRRSNNM